jgi:DnaJ-class molecular chaperone
MNDFLKGYKTYNPTIEGFGSAYDWRKQFHRKMSREEAEGYLGDDDPYTLLGIKRNASEQEIIKAFRKKAMEWHPDRNPDRLEEAEEMMKKINAAYSLLT